tara:strand:- start:1368 stop:1835 length:468 start_codon:yes stop_codon:yes gene_type:complete
MAFKLKSGNTTAFKQMGSSPAKQKFDIRGYPTAKSIANNTVKGNIAYGYKTTPPPTPPKPTNMGLPKNFNTSGKNKWVKRSKEILKKGAKKGSKFLGGKTLGVLGLLFANDAYSKTDQPRHHLPKAEPMSVKKVRAISKSLPNASSELMKKIKKK